MALIGKPKSLDRTPIADHTAAITHGWWRRGHEFEDAMGYLQAAKEARLAWDAIAERQYPIWSDAFCEELELTIIIWRKRYPMPALQRPFLDALCATAKTYDLPLPHYALLAVFRMRCWLMNEL